MMKKATKRPKKCKDTKQVEKMLGCDPLGTPTNQKEVIEYNITTFHRILKKMGATRVEVTYSGSGDSGQIDAVGIYIGEATEELKEIPKTPVEFYQTRGSWTPSGSEDRIVKQTEHLEEALMTLADDLISAAGYGGYGNDDGGQGTLYFHVDECKVELSHSINVITTEDYAEEWEVEPYEEDDETPAPAPKEGKL
jgi:hypothetical protein